MQPERQILTRVQPDAAVCRVHPQQPSTRATKAPTCVHSRHAQCQQKHQHRLLSRVSISSTQPQV